jgi:hypothetical protein
MKNQPMPYKRLFLISCFSFLLACKRNAPIDVPAIDQTPIGEINLKLSDSITGISVAEILFIAPGYCKSAC